MEWRDEGDGGKGGIIQHHSDILALMQGLASSSEHHVSGRPCNRQNEGQCREDGAGLTALSCHLRGIYSPATLYASVGPKPSQRRCGSHRYGMSVQDPGLSGPETGGEWLLPRPGNDALDPRTRCCHPCRPRCVGVLCSTVTKARSPCCRQSQCLDATAAVDRVVGTSPPRQGGCRGMEYVIPRVADCHLLQRSLVLVLRD